MNYNETIRYKNKLLTLILLGCIILRAIVNAIFVDVSQIFIYVIGGLILTAILFALVRKVHPVVMSYMIVILMSVICVVLMIAFPCTANYLMLFLAIFFSVIYEDWRPITLQCLISAVCMVVFFNLYADEMAQTWTEDTMAICLVYVVSGFAVFVALCRLNKKSFDTLQMQTEESMEQTRKANDLVSEIGKTVGVLGRTSDKINESVTVSGTISDQISGAVNDITLRAGSQVREAESIKSSMTEGVSQIRNMSDTSEKMAEYSNENTKMVAEGGKKISELSRRMDELNQSMDQIAVSISDLSEENGKIVTILSTLDKITSQTNLLSLNASIEAARAGENGRGFAVVASEIRTLSETSAKFTNEIHSILDGISKQTDLVRSEINEGISSVASCNENAAEVDGFFNDIAVNTKEVLDLAVDIKDKSQTLNGLLNATLESVNSISDDLDSTSQAMEKITVSISDMKNNIHDVADGYNDITQITDSLVDAADAGQK